MVVGLNERREAEATFERARELFDRVDANGDGTIDRYEIVGLVQQLWGELGIADGFQDESRLDQEVDEAMEHFGDPEGIKFPQFVRMLTKPPWRSLLPESVQEVLPILLLKENLDSAKGDDKEDQEESGLSIATQMFQDADADQDGHLDAEELRDVIEDWIEHCHQDGREPKLTAEQLDEHLANLFGEAGDGFIDIDQWIAMLAIDPWKSLLPSNLKDEIVLAAASVKAEAHPYSRVRTMPPVAPPTAEVVKKLKAPKETPGEQAFRMARELFEDADEDDSGLIDGEELNMLVSKLAGRLNVKVTPEMKIEFDDAVITAGQEYPDGLNFCQFIKMLNKAPWRDMLPEDIKAAIPKALMKLMKSDEGDEIRSKMSAAGSVMSGGSAGPKKAKSKAASTAIASKRSSERKAAPVRKCYPAHQQHLSDAVHAIREVFMTADADEDGYLSAADMERLAWHVWELTDEPPLDPQFALRQVLLCVLHYRCVCCAVDVWSADCTTNRCVVLTLGAIADHGKIRRSLWQCDSREVHQPRIDDRLEGIATGECAAEPRAPPEPHPHAAGASHSARAEQHAQSRGGHLLRPWAQPKSYTSCHCIP